MPLEQKNSYSEIADHAPEGRRKRLRNLIIMVLVVSLAVHVIAGLGAGIWVIARYFSQPKAQFVVQKQVQMNPEDRKHQLQMDEVSSLRPKPVYNNRIQSLRPSKLALPELPRVPMENIVPLDTDALVTDAVDGVGKYGQGNGAGGGFFGEAANPMNGLLEGTLYDLKQDENGRPVDMGPNLDSEIAFYKRTVSKFVASGLRESAMRSVYKVPKKLYLSQLAIPMMSADRAPKAFEANIQPKMWVIVYRGLISPPETGRYRFSGSADDFILVRLNNRVVFEGSLGPVRATNWDSDDRESHRGGWGKNWGDPKKHNVYGDWVTMQAGNYYPIEVVVGEVPGKSFYAQIFVQQRGKEYAEGPDGQPVLPLFRLQSNLTTPKNLLRPAAEDGPIFRAMTTQKTSSGL